MLVRRGVVAADRDDRRRSTRARRPRRRPAEEPAERRAARRRRGRKAPGEPAAGKTVAVVEKEYSIELPAGNTLEAGHVPFDVANKGKIQHDLAIEGSGGEEKTPLIDPGQDRRSSRVEV